MEIQDVFEELTQLELVRSQIEFSRIWLGRSPRYYSSLLARQQQPGVGVLVGLLFRLRNILAHTTQADVKAAIPVMIARLERHATLRSISHSPARPRELVKFSH